jgi:hypothetical protein
MRINTSLVWLFLLTGSLQAERVHVHRLPDYGDNEGDGVHETREGGVRQVETHESGGGYRRHVDHDQAFIGGGRTRVVSRSYYSFNPRPREYRTWNGHRWNQFYYGDRPYWARYHANNWWWYDPYRSHWTFWYNGYWWWSSPGAVYVYVNDGYYPYDPSVIQVSPPTAMPAGPGDSTYYPPTENATPPSSPQNPGVGTSVWYSPDGKRMVQVVGDKREAYLYETASSAANPIFMKALGENVVSVRFAGGNTDKPLEMQLEFQDRRFARFDASGNPLAAPAF